MPRAHFAPHVPPSSACHLRHLVDAARVHALARRAQGDDEKAAGLPVSQGFAREGHSRPDSQVGFLKFMVRPLYEAMGRLVPMPQQLGNLTELLDSYAADAVAGK